MSPEKLLQVCLIIPVYNEAVTIGRVVAEAVGLPPDPRYRLEILVVDGHSRDGTVAAAQQAGARVILQAGRGYGAACYSGYQAAGSAQILVFLDGDFSDPPAEIPRLLNKMLNEGVDLALGSRLINNAEAGALPVHAVWGNMLVLRLIKLFYRRTYSDLPSYKAIRRDVLSSFDMAEMSYGWTVEMLVKAARSGCKVVEIPVYYRKRGGGQSKVSGTIQGSAKAAYCLIKTAIKYRRWTPAA